MKKGYANVLISRADAENKTDYSGYTVKNDNFFVDLSNIEIHAALLENGVTVATKAYAPGVDFENPAPQGESRLDLAFDGFSLADFTKFDAKPGAEYIV